MAIAFGVVAALAAAASAHAAYPGGNGKIAFTSNLGGLSISFSTVDPDGTRRTRIAAPGDDPAWSPDGTRIAYTVPGTLSQGPQLAIVDADGTGKVLPTDTADNESQPSWSPDGEKIAVTRFLPEVGSFGAFEIFVMNVDGSGQARLTDSRADGLGLHATEPAWSPDGGKIAFTRTIAEAGNVDEEIYVINADGTGLTRLTENPSDGFTLSNDLSPAWSPDGTELVFSSRRDGRYGVHVMDADGGGVRRLLDAPQASFPAWSPDGTRIAFATGGGIRTIGVDGNDPAGVTDSPEVTELDPDWQPVNRAPGCAAVRATPNELWPPNKRLRRVTLTGATDPDRDTVGLTVTDVTHDEGDAAGDWLRGGRSADVLLRAARDPHGDGRLYTISFEATDEHGASCAGEAAVEVPRHGN